MCDVWETVCHHGILYKTVPFYRYTKSFLSFNDFILREALSLVDPVSGHLLRFLTIMRHPVSLRLLMTIGLYNEERIRYFLANEMRRRV